MTYKMFNDTALQHFEKFCDAANFYKPRSNPAGAFDAKPRYARDAAPDKKDHLIFSLIKVVDDLRPKGAEDEEPFTDITKNLGDLDSYLRDFMQPDAFKEAHETIIALIADCSDLIKAAHKGMNAQIAGGKDDDFPGKPIPGGGQVPVKGMDAALDSFNERYPMAKRIGSDTNLGVQPVQRAAPPSSAAFDSFAKRFPDAMKIGNS